MKSAYSGAFVGRLLGIAVDLLGSGVLSTTGLLLGPMTYLGLTTLEPATHMPRGGLPYAFGTGFKQVLAVEVREPASSSVRDG